MKIEISNLNIAKEYFEIRSYLGLNLISASNDLKLDCKAMLDAKETNTTLTLYDKKPLRSNLRAYRMPTVIRMLTDAQDNQVDVQSFMKYDRKEKAMYLDLAKMYPVYFRTELLDNWHAILSELALRNIDFNYRSVVHMINTGLEKLSNLPGGANFAYTWHQKHKNHGYRLPEDLRPNVSIERPKHISYYRDLTNRIWIKDYYKPKKRGI